jgi:hypothetical protein
MAANSEGPHGRGLVRENRVKAYLNLLKFIKNLKNLVLRRFSLSSMIWRWTRRFGWPLVDWI